ncbi:MAG: phospholipase D-like domain-containing protein [Prosthecobacter sp.]
MRVSFQRYFFIFPLLLSACATGRLQKLPETVPAVTTAAFAAEVSRLTGQSWTSGNSVRTLPNGGTFIPAMLSAIRSAQHTLTWENFVAVDSQPVADFTQAFIERAKAGVQVRILLDHYGCSTYGKAHLDAMRAAGIDLRFYSPWKLHHPLGYNHRTHRRILVADGKTGFVGGAGLAYAWDGDAEGPHRWRDTMYELRGPIVAQLQHAFNDNWQEITHQPVAGPHHFPALPHVGSLTAQSVLGAPKKGPDTVGSTFLVALRAAQKSIVISHAYFIPNRPIIDALFDAQKRGVHIELLVPGEHTDMPMCACTTAPLLRRFIQVGITVREFEPCMMHSKLVVIDDHLSIIGSGNIDSRSFFINDENNVLVLSPDFARQQLAMHQQDKSRSRLLKETDLRQPLGKRLKGWFGRRVQHQL